LGLSAGAALPRDDLGRRSLRLTRELGVCGRVGLLAVRPADDAGLELVDLPGGMVEITGNVLAMDRVLLVVFALPALLAGHLDA